MVLSGLRSADVRTLLLAVVGLPLTRPSSDGRGRPLRIGMVRLLLTSAEARVGALMPTEAATPQTPASSA